MSAQVPVMLTCVLMLLTCTQISQQQVTFYNTCQDASAEGTLRVSIKEVDSQATLDASPNEYRAGLGLAGNTQSIGLRFDASTTAKLPAAEYFELESGPRSGSLTGREWFLRLKKPIDRDGTRPDSLDDNTVFEYTLQCTDLTINTAFFMLLRVQIIDVNDNSPVFQNSPYAVSVNELTPIGTTVFQNVTATDLDFDVNKNIVFDIVAGAGSDKFAIDPRSGYVRVKNTLDFETMNSAGNTNYVLSIQAMDSAEPPEVKRTATTTLNVTIRDGDDQKPIFVYPTCYSDSQNRCFNPTYTVSMVSGQSPDEISVFPYPPANPNVPVDILARDQDTLNYPVIYSVEQTEPRGYENRFQVTSEQVAGTSTYRGRLQLVQTIDRAVIQELRVIIRIQEDSTNRRFNRAILYLTVTAANNNPPSVSTFIGSQIGYIRENDLTGAYIKDQQLQNALQLVITDADIATGDPPQQYTFEVTPASPFYIDSNNFLRLTAGPLDYESVQQYTFNVIVREQSTAEQRSGSISLTVNVVDINDNTPFFVGTPYRRSLPEGDYTQGNGEFIVQVVAQDRDSVDTSITYQIQSVSDGGAGKFTISDTSGQLLLRAIVKVGEDYIIIVNATDSTIPRRSASVPVYVTITSSGNKDPRIPSPLYTVYVSEGIEVNREIFTIPATDPDNQALTFSIISGNIGNAFTINNNGVVSNRVTLDRETVPEYNLTITAADLGSSPASTVLRVIVTDVNDNSPVFIGSVNNRYFFNVQEGQTPPAAVGSVSAVDGDQRGTPQATVIYDMVGPNAFFRIDGQTGTITTLVPLDYETQQQHEFTVRAIDSGASPRANVVTVVVSVIDTQDSIPLFVTIDNEGSIQENVNGTSILTVSAVDADQTDNIVYQFAGGEFQSFSINPTTGVISTVIPLDYEVKNRYVFTVTTSDGVNTNAVSSTATVTISVIDQNDFTPVLTTSNGVDNISVLENLGISEELVDVNAADSDPPNTPNSRVTFSISNVVPPSGRQLFFINPTTGQLVLRNPFTDDPGVPTYTVTILGTNEGSPLRTGVLTLTVNVIRNTAPVFNPTTLQANIDENSINQVVSVTTATATDVDTVSPFNVLTYTLRGDGPALDYFQINSASGEIQTRALLSTTTERSFTLRIRATDGGGLFADLRIDLTVNKNLNAPTLSPQNYTETIFENRALGSVITTIRASDADRQPPHNELSYSITGDATAQLFFAVNNRGEIYLIRSPAENQAISTFNMIVDVRDQGLPTNRPANPNPAFVTINVIRNANPPIFFTREYNRVIPENTTVGQFVETVTATDADSQGNFGTLRYSIIGDGTANTYFQINQNSGIVSVRTSLTNTPINDFTVRVVAQDGGSPPRSATAMLFVTVTRNFERPVWSSATYATSIPETAPVLENILRVTATDSDAQPPNNEVVYELVGDAVQLYYFEIVSSTGDIRPRRPLTSDPNRRSQFAFVVIARDKGSPPLSAAFNASVTISVFRNNNAPRFIQDPYSITVSQGLGSGTVITVRAVDDNPSTEFNQITYSIEGPANALALFTIDGSGNIQPTNPAAINSASETNYKIYVRAEDNGSPKLYDIALVELTINRNLNPPIFNPVTYEETILETRAIGDVVLRVTASDADNLRPNNEFTFSAFGSGLTFFNVNSQTGEVTVVNNLVQDSNTRYQLTVQATDKGASPLSSAQPATVTINVVRNQASPVFVQTPYDTTVLRTAGANTPVVTVTATDADTTSPYNEVTYGIASMTVNRFRINSATGEITLTQAIASDSQAQYGVTVFAQDGGNPRRVTYNTFTVGVDRNLNAPFLTNPSGPNFENSTTVLETIGFDYLIYDVDAFDADLSDPYRSLRFSIIGENTASTYFLINRDSGEIRLKSSLLQDTLQTPQYRLIVAVTDGGDPPRPAPTTATITVNVIRNLNAPRWVNEPYSATIDETVGANVNILNVLAVDDDTNAFNRVSYEIIGDSSAPAYFDVTPGGSIIRRQSLQSVSDTRFYLRIVASDNGVPPKTNTTVVSIIINRNLNTPVFSQLVFTTEIDETTEVGSTVLSISANDQDSVPPYNTVEFAQIPDGATGLTFFSLEADTGNVVLRRPLTGNTDSVYEFQALVRDKGVPAREQSQRATVRITIRRNNNDPFFDRSPYSVTINEDQAVGSQILTITAQDPDVDSPFNQVTLRVIGDEKGPTYFGLVNNQINVTRSLTLDTENDLRYTLRIEARDGGSPARSATGLVYITVNRNLRPPVFTTQAYSARIPETQGLAVSVVQVQATDGDRAAPFNTVRYEISGAPFSTLGRQYFMVDPVTGVVSVRRNLETDLSDTSVYRFIVDAIDGSGARAPQPANVDITVDRNLFPPVFITTNYTAVINNTTPQGSPVFTALATDSDSTSPFNVVQYSIIGDDGSQSFFNVDPNSGVVSLAQPVFSIPNTQFRVRLQAVDGSGLTDVEVLTVYIQRNLFAPVFTQTLYERVIQETIPVSTNIFSVLAQDSDQTAPYNTVSYYASGLSDRFLVNVNNGAVSVRRSLIGESGQTFTFQVYAQDGGTPPQRSQFVTVRINVTRNNFPPVFISEPYSQSLLATASAGDGVVQVTATDADVEFPFNNVRYDIIGDDNAPAIFQIDETSGQISLRNTFSSDGAELYRIRVRARDGGNPRLSDITVVTVNVTRNLRAPVFNTPTYSARILEIINFGEVFISATAQDLDTSAPNNALTYQLTGNTECQRYFGIDNNGGLYVRADLVTDPTRATLYTCQVSAQDQGNPRRDSTNQATVSINVIRNTAPEFTGLPYNAVLQRNVTTGKVVGTFTVTDSDRDPPFNERNFRILGDGNAPALFNLNGNNVVVTSAADLAADTTSSYTVRLEVRDGGRSALSGTSVMNIQVIRNLATPVFTNSFIERNINEDFQVGGLITILNATDSDPQAPNNVLTYLALNPSSTDYLYVNPINGEVRTQRSFIGSTVRQYDFLVRVQDGGSPPKTAIATVRVNVARDSQTLAFRQDNYVVTIAENTPVTSNIINVEAIPGPDVIYRLTGYSDSGDYFSVNPNNGQITVIKDLTTDVSRRPTFYLQVEAEKQFTVNLQKAVANVTITVQRNINGPIFNETDSIYEVIIDETRALGSVVLQLYAPDADGDSVRYEVVNYQASETDFLYLEPFSGLIRVAKPLTSTSTRRFEFTVRARDGMNPERSSTASVIVNVRGDNQPPAFFDEPYLAQLNFSDPVGTRVFIAQGGDPDLIGQMNYELTGQYLSAPAFFRVDRTTGEIFLSSSISTESASTYILGLSTFDSARPNRRDFTNLTITINQNPNAPAFARFQYYTTISETYDLGVSIIQIEASDPDGQTLSYTVEAANPTGCDSYFLLGASGLILTSRSLTTSTFPQCTMNVRIQDNGAPVRQSTGVATATIRIDRNIYAPEFRGGPYTRTIPETQNIGFTVFQFQATDADRPNTDFSRLEYSLIGDDSTGNFFEINSQTGVFTVRSQLDRNDISRYVARVVVKDRGSPSKSATVTGIVYIQRNLNGPVFNPTLYETTIFETHALRDSVVRVVATDEDRPGPQSTLTFSLQDSPGNFASSFFRIDAASGNIFARLPLTQDLTHRNSFEFSVIATDQGVPAQASVSPALVRVNIIRNLYSPVFQSEPYSARIDFTAPVNSSVTNVLATDADTVGPFSRVTYSLIGDGLATSLFTVTPDTGAIRTQNTLNSDTSEQYVLRVVAMDGGSPRLTDTSTVVVTVNRNLNAPQLQPQNYSVGILSTQALSIPILTINAADGDVAAPYNTVQYEVNNLLSSPPGRLYFTVDRNTGAVSLRCFLESDTSYTGVYIIVVDAVDGGGLKASPPARVEITVDRNTTLQSVNDTNSTSPRASLCCQEPLLPYWGGGSKTYISCISYDYWGSCLRFSGLCSIMQFTGSSLMLSTLSFKCVMIGFM